MEGHPRGRCVWQAWRSLSPLPSLTAAAAAAVESLRLLRRPRLRMRRGRPPPQKLPLVVMAMRWWCM